MGGFQELIAELRRRRVFRALLGWGIVSFAVLQVVEPLMHALDLPDWTLKPVVAVLGLGFPVTAVLAWTFDLTATGVVRTPLDEAEADRSLTGPRLAILLVGLGLLAAAPGIVYFFVWPAAARNAPASPNSVGGRPSIAVLPFADVSPNHDQDYFSDGVAEEILTALSKVEGLRVPGRASSFYFKGKNGDPTEIAQKLGVAHLLEGSVRQSGNMLRITAEVVRVVDGERLWSQTFDRELTDVFAVQEEIARAVVAALKVKLLPGRETALELPATNPEAYAQVLLARHLVVRGSPEGYGLAVSAFRKAVELDPKYAPAWAGLAKAIFRAADSVGWYHDARQNDLERALAAADKAIALGPDLPDGYAARGFLRFNKTNNWTGAREDLARALALSPGNAEPMIDQGALFAALGRLPESIAILRKASELDPLSEARWRLAFVHLGSGHLEEGRATAQHTLDLFPEHAHAARTLGFALLLENRLDEAQVAFQRSSIPAFREMGTALVEHARGHPQESRQALEHIIATWPNDMTYQIAEIHAFCGNMDRAFEWLGRALGVHDAGLQYVKYDPLLGRLRGDARYTAILKKMNLPLD